ncbi:MAG: radical SAM family heme chaperone HemW [Clostridia bacterium]|nr:radical SAM family heme chaperone HemW [Clostridia bacterium]
MSEDGTPSFIQSKYIVSILNLLKQEFNISKNVEITIEVNPGTIDKQKLEDYKISGINRISIGLQSTKSELLKLVGRIHSYKQFLEVYNLAREVGFKNINVDLMIGLPVQTLQDVENDLERITKLNPEHISVYSLIVEEGTKIEEKIKNKELYLPSEELERKMYWKVKNVLEEKGYIHYEISNFSKKGFESKHNLACWNQEEYIGFGIASHSYINNKRYSNTDDLEKYVVGFSAHSDPQIKITHETQNKEDTMKEYMLLGLRKIDGVKISEFKNKFVENPVYKYREELNKLATEGLIEIDIDSIRLTNKGIDLANLVWEEFV